MRHLILLNLAILLCATTIGCTPNNDPRWVHEGKKEWTASNTPDDESVRAKELNEFDLSHGYAILNDPKTNLIESLLKPLSRILLNKKFVENPAYRTLRLSQLLDLFNGAFLRALEQDSNAAGLKDIKERYYQTVFSGCSRDLRGNSCNNAEFFSGDGHHTRIFTLLAKDLDAELDKLIAKSGSPQACIALLDCRNLIEERYRRLAMAVHKRNRNADNDFAFAYVKYAKLFSLFLEHARTPSENAVILKRPGYGDKSDLSTSFLSETHGQIFEILIDHYKPKSVDDPEVKAFVENFNPWISDQEAKSAAPTGKDKKASQTLDLFKNGVEKMFELGTQCCLYVDKNKVKLSKSFTDAIEISQNNQDAQGASFRQMVAEIKAEHGDRIFTAFNMQATIQDIERPGSSFYNEYFFMVDRLFRGHISPAQVDMMLYNTNRDRAIRELPRMIATYIRINMLYLVVDTNRSLGKIYHTNLGSDTMYEEVIARSSDIANRWHNMQANIDLLDRLLGSYFKSQNTFTDDYMNTDRLIRGVNRNINYLAVFPNLIVIRYYLAKMNGIIRAPGHGEEERIDASQAVKEFFDVRGGAVNRARFAFGKDPEELDRLMLLYSFEFLLSTDALQSYAPEAQKGKSARGQFLEMLFSRYLDDDITSLRQGITKFERETFGDPKFNLSEQACRYEIGGTRGSPPVQVISFNDLGTYTYTGIADTGVNAVLGHFLAAPASLVAGLNGTTSIVGTKDLTSQLAYRRTYLKTMIDVVTADLLRTHAIRTRDDEHPDLTAARKLLKSIDEMQIKLTKDFNDRRKFYFSCMVKLQEVERRRANRLYDEERAHLGKIFDLMATNLANLNGAELDAKIAELNGNYFRNQSNEAGRPFAYRFDRFEGLSYRMSKYDLFMRIKNNIEKDIFVKPTAREIDVYKSNLNSYLQPRAVSVYIPTGLERDDMVMKGLSVSIPFNGPNPEDRNQFIREGMKALNGKEAFVNWQSQWASDKFVINYFESLEQLYLLPLLPAQPADQEITKEDLLDAYLKSIATASLDPVDVANAIDFGVDGRFPKEFYQGRIFEKDGNTSLPLFSFLMSDLMAKSNEDLDTDDPNFIVNESLKYARAFGSMQAFVFEPSSEVKDSIGRIYGERANYRLKRINDLFTFLAAKETEQTAASLDPRLLNPLYLDGEVPRAWYPKEGKWLSDSVRRSDQALLIRDFIRRSGNFYGTKEKVKGP